MTTAAEVGARRAARNTLRDFTSNGPVPPGTGERSEVSVQKMTMRSYQVAAATGGPRQPSGMSSTEAAHFNAGTTPTRGQASQAGSSTGTSSIGDGAREGTQTGKNGTGKNGQTPSR